MNPHRPRKPFRFEYIKGKYSGLTKELREQRAFSEWEREYDGDENVCEFIYEYIDIDKDRSGQMPPVLRRFKK